jgi:peptidoglycan/LPS O-acetylase OafA/YrhL
MKAFRRHRWLTSWLSALALVCNALVASFGHTQAAPATGVDELLGPLVICTAHGAQTEQRSGGDGSPRQLPPSHCPACLLHAKIVLAVAAATLGIDFSAPPEPGPPPHPDALVIHLDLGGIGSRAPPYFA